MRIRGAEGQQLYLKAGLAPPATLIHSYAPFITLSPSHFAFALPK